MANIGGSFLSLALYLAMFLMGALLFVVWFRERTAWTQPYCKACRYDLRGRGPDDTSGCPECGADLRRPRAIGYVGRARWPWLIWLSLCLMLTPFAVIIIRSSVVPWASSHGGPAATSAPHPTMRPRTAAPQGPIHPLTTEDWTELVDRIRAGTLDSAEADRVLQSFARELSSQRPESRGMLLPWPEVFLRVAHRAGLFSQQALTDLADAYYPNDAVIRGLPEVHVRDIMVTARIDQGGRQNTPIATPGRWLPIDKAWKITGVTIDGKPASFHVEADSSSVMIAWIDLPKLDAGTYEIEAELACAYLESDASEDGEPSATSADDWSGALKQWTAKTRAKLNVVGENRGPIFLSTDPALDPGPDGVVPVFIAVQDMGGRKMVTVKLAMGGLYEGTLSYDVAVVIGGRWYDAGYFFYKQTDSRMTRGEGPMMLWLQTLDPSLTTADIVLTPNPEHAAKFLKADAIWGKPTTFKDIPLKRYDLTRPGGGGEAEPSGDVTMQINAQTLFNQFQINGVDPRAGLPRGEDAGDPE